MKPEIEDTDIIIRRAANGWIVFSGSEYIDGHSITTFHVPDETEWGEHEALANLIHAHFSHLTQSKRRGGIKMEVRRKGWDIEYEEEEEKIVYDYDKT